MQIQKINSNYSQKSSPSFQANHIAQITSKLADKSEHLVDVYTLNKTDKNFIERFLEVIKNQEFGEDKFLIGKDVAKTVKTALKKALKLDKNAPDKILLSVENNKKITGIMDLMGRNHINIKELAVWHGEHPSKSRNGLILTAMKEALKTKEDRLVATINEPFSKVTSYLKNLGFRNHNNYFYIEDNKLAQKITNLQDKRGLKMTSFKKPEEIDIINKMDL